MSVGASHGFPDGNPKLERVSALEGHALWAGSYSRTENPLLALEERMMDSLLPKSIDGCVIDVACGTGRWLNILLQRGACEGLGVDFSPEMLVQASVIPRLRGKLIRGDCRSLPFPEGMADVLICAFALGYVEDIDAFSMELARVTKSGASVWISDFHPQAYARGWKRAFRSGSRAIELVSRVRTCQEIHDAFHRAGFQMNQLVNASLGEPERKIFERAGKLSQFDSVRNAPAVLIVEYRNDAAHRGQS